MSSILTIAVIIVGIVAVLLIIIWLGFQIEPESFSPHPEIPEPVKRYYEAAAGSVVPEVKSAVVWGKAKLRINGIWMPVRFKAYYIPGQAFLRYIEVTWFGKTVLKVSDSYMNGEGVLKIEGLLNKRETGEKIDQGQNLAMWGEAVFMPSVFFTDTSTRWEAVDDETVRLVIPSGKQNDSLDFKFDLKTGLISQIWAMRYKGQNEEKTPWLIDITEWMTAHYVKIPSRFSVTWEDEGSPWSYWTVEDVEYNIEITEIVQEKEVKQGNASVDAFFT